MSILRFSRPDYASRFVVEGKSRLGGDRMRVVDCPVCLGQGVDFGLPGDCRRCGGVGVVVGHEFRRQRRIVSAIPDSRRRRWVVFWVSVLAVSALSMLAILWMLK